jgi:hypothetical protein
MSMCSYRGAAIAAAAVVIGLTTGCASTVPKPEYSREIVASSRVTSPDQAQVKVEAAHDLEILPADKERLAEKISTKIYTRKAANVSSGGAKTYQVELHLTRYEKGSAVARFLLIGLGQIHIEGTVAVFQTPGHVPVGEFELKKTFAWGGIYGAVTSMDDIENTFADGVAAAVTGQKEDPPKEKS